MLVTGDLDISRYPEFIEALASVPGDARQIVIDLSDVTVIDSMSVGALLLAKFKWDREGRVMATVVRELNVLRVLDIIHARERLSVVSSYDEALLLVSDGCRSA